MIIISPKSAKHSQKYVQARVCETESKIKSNNRHKEQVKKKTQEKPSPIYFIGGVISVIILAVTIVGCCWFFSTDKIIAETTDVIKAADLGVHPAEAVATEETEATEVIKTTDFGNIINDVLSSQDDQDNEKSINSGSLNDFSNISLAVAVKIEGETEFYLQSIDDCESLLTTLKDRYVKKAQGDIESIAFKEKIKLVEGLCYNKDILTVQEALDYIDTSDQQQVKYLATKNETLASIAENNNMELKQLLVINKDLKANSVLQEGQEINVYSNDRLIDVVINTHNKVERKEAYITETKTNPLWLASMKTVTQKGVKGIKEVECDQQYINGALVAETIINEKVIQEPVNEVITVGDRSLSSSRSEGAFVWPYGGEITSEFGARWGSQHEGIDIGGPEGDPVCAAASGTITLAEYYGGYGNCIMIDHGSGVVTLYGHLSAFNCAVGDYVSKGQNIGTVGNTGNSTGSHLHFEVQIDGTACDPMNYLP